METVPKSLEILQENSWSVSVGDGGPRLKVHFCCDQGGRKYMEDVICGTMREYPDPYAFFAVYDGHGGTQAAQFAKDHLHNVLMAQKAFWSTDDDQVLGAMKKAFVETHQMMYKDWPTWPTTVSGFQCTAGTTASVVVIKNNKIYVAHVGDSSVVVGSRDNSCADPNFKADLVTIDHKPESPCERKRIESSGGKVMTKAGVHRVVWRRPRPHQGPVRRSTPIDDIPFLAVARALGDLWSYNSEQDVFVVSPDPDTAVYDLDFSKHRSIVMASDGLWNMVRPHEAVVKADAEPHNPAEALVDLALLRWRDRKLRADNTSVIVLFLESPSDSAPPSKCPSEASTAILDSEESAEASPCASDSEWNAVCEAPATAVGEYESDALSPLPPAFGLGSRKNIIVPQPDSSRNTAPAKSKASLNRLSKVPHTLKRCLEDNAAGSTSEPVAKKLKDAFDLVDESPANATSAKSPIKLPSSGQEESPSVGVVSPLWPEPCMTEDVFKAADNVHHSTKSSVKSKARKRKLKAKGRQNQFPQKYVPNIPKRSLRKCGRYILRRKR